MSHWDTATAAIAAAAQQAFLAQAPAGAGAQDAAATSTRTTTRQQVLTGPGVAAGGAAGLQGGVVTSPHGTHMSLAQLLERRQQAAADAVAAAAAPRVVRPYQPLQWAGQQPDEQDAAS